ncbi:MAG TPA: hypothetical protein VIG97_02365 [Luteimonas sp.]
MRDVIRLAVILVAAMILTACAGRDARPAPPPVREVKVPVLVPCATSMPAKPAFAVDALPIGSDVWQQMAALRAERLQRKGYEQELEAALLPCLPDREKAG